MGGNVNSMLNIDLKIINAEIVYFWVTVREIQIYKYEFRP